MLLHHGQAHYLTSRLELFEIASLVLIAVVVAIVFRSPVTPAAVLAVGGIAYLVATRLLGLLAAAFGFALPDQIRPVIVALLLGVVTDYSVLFLSTFRHQLHDGHQRREATTRTLRQEAAVVTVAALTVAGGTIALLAANLQLFRAGRQDDHDSGQAASRGSTRPRPRSSTLATESTPSAASTASVCSSPWTGC